MTSTALQSPPATATGIVPLAASALQKVLPELVALSLNAKQVHWHVTGPGFLPLHALTDQIAADALGWADRVAERTSDKLNEHDEPMTTSTAKPDRPGNRARRDRLVDNAGLDSFPASDPPGWWAGPEPTRNTPTTGGTPWP